MDKKTRWEAGSNCVKLVWENVWGVDNEIINRPILYDGKPIGVIKSVTEDYISGILLHYVTPILNPDATVAVSFELVNHLSGGSKNGLD